MLRCILAGTMVFAVCSVNAQTINLRGKISNGSGAAVSGAIVTLAGQNLKDTTGSDGMYEIKQTTDVIVYQELQPEHKNFIVEKGALVFSLPEATPLKIELFDVKGNLLKREAMSNVPKGFYRFGIAQNVRAAKVLIIRVVIGNDAKTFRYLPLKNGSYVLNQVSSGTASTGGNRLLKIAAINDTIKVTADGYVEKSQAIVSYDQEMNITLEAEGNGFTGSAGCGKAVGNVNSTGTVSTVAGRGTYRIKFPANYDKDKPYRLIFAMHCMGASSQDIAGNNYRSDGAYNYYGLGSLATDAILIAPEGNSGGTWNPGSDEQFFSDLLEKLKNDFCIDTSRVFVCGFSFGAMYSYALSLAHPEQIRAVACYAPANWNFDPQPTNRHIPVAYYQTTGTGDDLCKWINNDSQKKGGKYCLLQHVEDNGCDANQEIKLATSGTHVTTEFKGCDEGYPVKFSSFNGGHTAGESWMPQETWEFFSQF